MSEDDMQRDAEVREREARKQTDRRRRLAAALADELPERTRDERPDAWGDSPSPSGGAGHDEWLRNQKPPHHGG